MATALKKLKDLATDAVVVPTTAELYRRKATELDTARQKHAGIVARQIQDGEPATTPPQRHRRYPC